MLKNVQTVLTALCGIFLVASLFPGADHIAFFAIVCGSYFALRSAWEALRERTVDVNILMLLAAIGAILLDEERDAAALLFLFSLSSTLEAMAMARTRSAIEGLIKLRPDSATLVTPEGDRVVKVEELRPGDSIRIKPYESVPADGEVLSGQSELNQAVMTGESIPVPVAVGDRVLAGTQNMQGMLVVNVTAGVENSALQRIVSLVQEAQENKASGERISAWFGERYTFIVLGIFLIVLVGHALIEGDWLQAARESLTLLVALSPCALVISTPASTLSALTWAARHGILVRGGEYIELAGKIDTLAVDKTGTLTTGRPRLVEICVCEEFATIGQCDPGDQCWHQGYDMSPEATRLLRFAAAAEQLSTHPVADAIVTHAKECGIDIPAATKAETITGMGVHAMVEGHTVRIGRRTMFGDTLPESFERQTIAFERSGMTVAVLQVDDRFAALGAMDVARDEAASFVREVRALGVKKVVMLTGDTAETANAVAKLVAVDETYPTLLPAQKTEKVDELVSQGCTLMMVGDGVNDAPSLAKATVGVAMGGLGSDIALNAADVVLMQDRLSRIPDLIRLGMRTNGVIRANLIFASGVILCLTVSSLIGVLPLWLAVIGHEGSTVIVIVNGLRLLNGPIMRLDRVSAP